MRKLTIIVAILAALYSGYWFVGKRSVSAGAENAIAQMQAQGWQVQTAGIGTRGFPSRFDTTVDQLTLSPPDRTWRYSAPFVQALALSYRPNQVIAVLPDTQTLDLPGQTLTINTDQLRASTGVAASTSLAFQGFTAEGEAVQIASTLDWGVLIPKLLAAMRPAESVGEYDLYVELNDVALQQSLAGAFAPAPDVITRVMADGVVTLDKPIDRISLEAAETDPILPTAFTLRDAVILWGAVEIRAKGDLTFPGGVPEGKITVTVGDYQELLSLLVATGALPSDQAANMQMMAGLMADGEKLAVPLSFKDGFMAAGPIPLGPAPRIY